MGKSIHDSALDALLDYIADNGNLMTICSQEPTTRTEAVTTYALADVALTVGDGNGDYTKANGDTSGRKLTIGAQSGITVDATGNGDHIAVVSGTELLAVTPFTARNSGTAQAGASTTITLAAGASATDDEYNGAIVEITSGTGSGQRRIISDYVGSTKVATVSAAWSTNPDATSVYVVRGQLFTSGNTADVAAVDIAEVQDPS